MTDTPSASSTPQASASGQPQAGQQTTETPQAGGSPSAQLSPADYERQIAELRKENAAHRTKLNAFERAKAEADEASLSEVEKAQKKVAAAEAALADRTRVYQERLIRAEIKANAAALGIIDPDAVVRLLDWSELEYDDEGAPANTDKLIAALLKAKPYLAPQAAPAPGAHVSSGGAMNPGRAATSGAGDLTWERISRMSQAEYDAIPRSEMLAFLARNPRPPKH